MSRTRCVGSLKCHPDGLLLAEGSPGMIWIEMQSRGSSAILESLGRRATSDAIKTQSSREIPRATHALRNDRAYRIASYTHKPLQKALSPHKSCSSIALIFAFRSPTMRSCRNWSGFLSCIAENLIGKSDSVSLGVGEGGMKIPHFNPANTVLNRTLIRISCVARCKQRKIFG